MLLPVAVADPILRCCDPVYREYLDVSWLREKTVVEVVDLPAFDVEAGQVAHLAASVAAGTLASVGLLVGCFSSYSEISDWVGKRLTSDVISTENVVAYFDDNIKIVIYKLGNNAHENLTDSAFFTINNVQEQKLYALFIDR